MKKLFLLLIPFASFGQVKISDMPAATSLSGTEILPIVQGGVNKKSTTALLWAGALPFSDNSIVFQNSSDNTKKAKFNFGGLSTATTRTYSFPDFNGGVLIGGGNNNSSTSETDISGTNGVKIGEGDIVNQLGDYGMASANVFGVGLFNRQSSITNYILVTATGFQISDGRSGTAAKGLEYTSDLSAGVLANTNSIPSIGTVKDGAYTFTNKTISGSSNTLSNINLSSLAQSGATTNQVATWNGSSWVPQTPSGGGGGFYQTIQNAGSGLTQRNTFNFTEGLTAVDNSGSSRTDVKLGGTLTADVLLSGRKVTIKDGGTSQPVDGAGLEIQETTGNVNGAVLDLYNTAANPGDRMYEFHAYANNSSAAKTQMTAIYTEMVAKTAGSESGRQLMNLTVNGTLQEYFKAQPSVSGTGVELNLAQNAQLDQVNGKALFGPLYTTIAGYFSYGKSLAGQLLGGFANTTGSSGYAEFSVSNDASLPRSLSLSFTKFNSAWANVGAYMTNSGVIEAGSSVDALNIVSSSASTGKVGLYAGGINSGDLKLLAQPSGVTLSGTTVLSSLTTNGILTTSGGTGTVGVTTVLPVANGGTGTSTPGLVAGTNVTISGAWPNQTINATGGGTYYAPSSLAANATDADFTATVNSIKRIPDGVATANRNITIPAGSDGDVIEIYNSEDTFIWGLTGSTVYLADRVTVVTSLLYNVPTLMQKIDGLWIIKN